MNHVGNSCYFKIRLQLISLQAESIFYLAEFRNIGKIILYYSTV